MRTFQVACIALAAASASALSGYGSETGLGASYYGSGYGLGGASYTTGYAPAAAYSTGYAPATAYSTGYTQAPATYGYAAAAPVASYGYGYAAAAPVSYGYAHAPVSYGIAAAVPAAAPAYTQIAAPAPAAVKSHEIHTTSGRQAIRIEEQVAGDQLIRVHEAPQAGPQVAQIQVPGDRHHVRVISHQAGPAEVQRVVQRQETQVFNVQKAGRPGARIVQVVRGESPAPTVEFVSSGGSNHHVYHANDIQSAAPIAATYAAGPVATYAAAPVASYAAPIATYGAAPIAATYSGLASTAYGSSYAAPAYTTSYSSGSSYQAAPSTISYSGSIGSSTGAGSYGSTAVISKA